MDRLIFLFLAGIIAGFALIKVAGFLGFLAFLAPFVKIVGVIAILVFSLVLILKGFKNLFHGHK
ncbi:MULTISPECIES: hypothetical protein [Bacillaceae]|uniref:hypothetical protein n=1 Tax=Bacillaceae TaxID=186817 RepID=UPI000C785270|nr:MULTISPECIES: hypothetical protein [Bacillaceae]PLR68917.1 hypothetical protein CYJ36_00160 [Bacillus sp. UMB0893]QNG59622.1 hypothetical protein H4O14_17845 [Bacillus sp. PAMC26568]